MALAMQAAALFGKLFVVLDRPNPLGGIMVQGPVLQPPFSSFVGMYPIPLRHGMTAGELALLFNTSFDIGADLAVIRMRGWRRRLWFDETGLQWRPPSPAMLSPDGALLYAGTCLFEGTNISEGRGTSAPFRLIGAPWLSSNIIEHIDDRWLDGLAVSPQKFTPTSSKYKGDECTGIRIDTTDRETADPAVFSVALLAEIAMRHHGELTFNEFLFDSIAGTDELRRQLSGSASKELCDLTELFGGWERSHREFETTRSQHLLYEG
jgi:beta-N-acetylhexosaminidase